MAPMAVELLILSGSRLGERLKFTHDAISIGGGKHWDVCFDAKLDPGATAKRARILADEFGWRIHNDGLGAWIINQDVLPPKGAYPLRAGDIVRLSEFGPDLRFNVLPDAGGVSGEA
jgi:hypothetical protein